MVRREGFDYSTRREATLSRRGDHEVSPYPHVTRFSTVCLCQSWATDALVPPGGFEPPLHGLRARRAAFTLRREWSEWSDSNRHRKAWKACRQPLPHIRFGSAYGYRTRPSTLAPWNAASTLRPNSGRRRRRPTDILQFSKSPFISNRLVGSQGIEPRVPIGEIGVTGRQRDHPLVLPV
jgi:hypothetical protein